MIQGKYITYSISLTVIDDLKCTKLRDLTLKIVLFPLTHGMRSLGSKLCKLELESDDYTTVPMFWSKIPSWILIVGEYWPLNQNYWIYMILKFTKLHDMSCEPSGNPQILSALFGLLGLGIGLGIFVVSRRRAEGSAGGLESGSASMIHSHPKLGLPLASSWSCVPMRSWAAASDCGF